MHTFKATLTKADHTSAREVEFDRDDIDDAVAAAVYFVNSPDTPDDEFVSAVRQDDAGPQWAYFPDVCIVLGGSALTKTVKGELVETVDWIDGKPDWSGYGIADPYRGAGGPRGFEALGRALDAAEENYESVFGEKPTRLPD